MINSVKSAFAVEWKMTGRRVFVGVVLFSLVTTLATRTFHVSIPHGITAQSGAAQAMRQHLDRDAARWVPPTPIFTALLTPTFYPHVAPAASPLGVLLLDESLYNRPPPFC
jgi:hypothetical protein